MATQQNRRVRAFPLIFIAVLCVLCFFVAYFLLRPRTAPAPVGEEARLRAAVVRAPHSGTARQALGRYYLDRGQTFEAIWELGAARRLAPGEPAISLQLAVALANASLYDQAIAQLEPLAARRPPARDGRVQLATLYLGTMQPGKARAVLRAAPDVEQWPEEQIALGQVYEALGQQEPAIAAYQRAHHLAPGSSIPLYRLGSLYLREGNIAAARAALEQARQKNGAGAPALTLLAEAYLRSGATEARRSERSESAKRYLRESANEAKGRKEPGKESIVTGSSSEFRSDFASSLPSRFRAKSVSPLRPVSRFRTAERWLLAARKVDPSYVPALVALGRLYRGEARVKEALQADAEALRLAPGDPAANEGAADLLQSGRRTAEAHGVRARYFRAKGLPVRAIREYEAMARAPAYRAPAVMEMGLILLETRQKARALQVTKAALALHPREPALYERLVVLEMLWDSAQALQWCEQWQRLEPRSVRPIWLRGRILADRGDWSQAVSLLQQVADAEPENMDYTVTLAEALLGHRDRATLLRARRLLERAVARPSADAKTYQDLAQTLEQIGQPEAARRAFLRSLDLDPNPSVTEPYVSLVRLARQLGQPEQIDLWGPIVRTVEERLREETLLSRRTWEAPEGPAGYRDLALHFLRNAELRKAESQLEEALRLRPGWPEVQQLLASVRRTREVL